MKPQTYFRLALLFPYALWVVCALILFTLQSILETSDAWSIILMPMTFYVFGIILWLIPYSLLVIGLGVWSRNKSTDALRKIAFAAPILFFTLMLIEVVLVSLPAESMAEFTKELLGQSAMLGIFSLIFGYLCVGVALGIFKFMQTKKLIAEETLILLPET